MLLLLPHASISVLMPSNRDKLRMNFWLLGCLFLNDGGLLNDGGGWSGSDDGGTGDGWGSGDQRARDDPPLDTQGDSLGESLGHWDVVSVLDVLDSWDSNGSDSWGSDGRGSDSWGSIGDGWGSESWGSNSWSGISDGWGSKSWSSDLNGSWGGLNSSDLLNSSDSWSSNSWERVSGSNASPM